MCECQGIPVSSSAGLFWIWQLPHFSINVLALVSDIIHIKLDLLSPNLIHQIKLKFTMYLL